MERLQITPRTNWEEKLLKQGFVYYKDYYTDDVCYQFTKQEIENLENATNEIFELCIKGLEFVLNSEEQLNRFKIPKKFHDVIKRSWQDDSISFYGRFDLAYNGKDIKLLEFNADTPTSLLEASIIQWYWVQDYNSQLDQFNSVHEKLVEHLKVCKPYIPDNLITFTTVEDNEEDFMTTKYLEDCAVQAGVYTNFLDISKVSINDLEQFCDTDGNLLQTIFKLYPYEWMFHEEFADYIIKNYETTQWIEPLYKAIWSNKMFMVILSELFPFSPYILNCQTSPEKLTDYVKKPLLSREGSNVTIVKNKAIIEQTDGEYGDEGFIYQEYFEIPKFNNKTPIIGSWLIGGVSAGIGIRESSNLITDNKSQFIPHFFK